MVILFEILFIITCTVLFFYLKNRWREKSQVEIVFERMFNDLFPGGARQKEKEVKTIMKLSGNQLTEEEALRLLLTRKMELAIKKKKMKEKFKNSTS